jgi:hypothetical protein
MKVLIPTCSFAIVVFLLLATTGCEPNPTESSEKNIRPNPDTSVVVYKPNIYLYPKTESSLLVELLFPLGGSIIQSVPSYLNGWRIEVEPSGKIDHQYDFLFYECQTPNAYQYNSGWVVSRDTLSSFFSANLLDAGFRGREIADFTEYWIPRLTDHPYYIIYPQFADDIGKVIQLKLSESPDNMLRVFYVIKGSEDNRAKLITPAIPKFVRDGFVVAEWGVVLK